MRRNPISLQKCALLCGTAILFAALADTTLPARATPTITEFDIPGSAYTVATGINTGTITGYYQDASGFIDGFVRAANGTITTFRIGGVPFVYPSAINDRGAVTGVYQLYSGGDQQCFLRAPNGTISTFTAGDPSTVCTGINHGGEIVGFWGDPYDYMQTYGFVRSAKGVTTTFDAGGNGDPYTFGLGINRSGYSTGSYTNELGQEIGFVRGPDGYTSTFTVDGAQTGATGINNSAAIVGCFIGTDYLVHSFIRPNAFSITPFDPPGAQSSCAVAIDQQGRIAGYTTDSSSVRHGYERLVNGTFATFDPPGSVYTVPAAIDAGVITGSFYDSADVQHGFLRSR